VFLLASSMAWWRPITGTWIGGPRRGAYARAGTSCQANNGVPRSRGYRTWRRTAGRRSNRRRLQARQRQQAPSEFVHRQLLRRPRIPGQGAAAQFEQYVVGAWIWEWIRIRFQ